MRLEGRILGDGGSERGLPIRQPSHHTTVADVK